MENDTIISVLVFITMSPLFVYTLTCLGLDSGFGKYPKIAPMILTWPLWIPPYVIIVSFIEFWKIIKKKFEEI